MKYVILVALLVFVLSNTSFVSIDELMRPPEIDGENAEIYLMSLVDGYNDDVDRFLLGKAALNYIDLHGGVNVIYTGDDTRLAKALGFKVTDDTKTLNLTGYFGEKHCN